VIAFLGFSAIFLGLGPMLRGDLFFSNWFHGLVFAPLAVIFGVVMILMAIFTPKYLWETDWRQRRGQRH